MATAFRTSAAVSLHKEPPLEVLPALPEPPTSAPVVHAALTLATGMACAVAPVAVPGLLLALAAWHLWNSCTADLRQRRMCHNVAHLAARAARQMGPNHPLVRTLGRYHRLLVRVSGESPNVTGWRGAVRRRALLQRLAHRCQTMLDTWPLWSVPPQPSDVAYLGPLRAGPMMLRSRKRRGLRAHAA